jgi:ABC-2 type transport system permease protein
MKRLASLIRKELLQLKRDVRMRAIILVAPVVQVLILGYAADWDVRDVPAAVYDQDRTADSRAVAEAFRTSGTFVLAEECSSWSDVDDALLSGRAEIAVAIPPGFSRDLRSRSFPQLELVVDGSRSNTAAVALAYATGIAASFGAGIEPTAAPPGPSVDARIRVWYNPELRSRLFMVPGIFALLAMVFTIILTALAIVKEKESGTLEQLMASPLRRGELVAGKLAPFLLVSTVTLTLALAAVRVFFGIVPRGSLGLLALLSVLFSISTLGIGLFVSTLARTQQQAMLSSIFFFMFPMIMLSGFVFPIENMPAEIQAVTYLMPLRYYLRIVRSLFLKGSGLAVLWPEALALAGLSALYVSVAVARFRKRM